VWVFAVIAAASQWYLYDAVHGQAERLTYYVLTCAYLCGVLTPLVLWLGARWPIDSRSWKRSLPVHIACSLLLTAMGVFIEASISWLPHAAEWRLAEALRHYFTYHTQISLITYWALLAAFHVYRMYDQARRREIDAANLQTQLTEAQLANLRTQLQPHFLFNTLQAASTLIYDDPQGAEDILLSLSELLRVSLQTFKHQETTLRREIDFVKHYAEIQERRFGDRLRFDFQVDEEALSCAVPSLLLQPLVENAIRHGIGVYKGAEVISICAFIEQGQLRIEITNRLGVLDGNLETLVSRGVGLANTIARLERLYGVDRSFMIRNIPPRGVMVSLSIPAHMVPLAAAEELEAQPV
jgi:two-component system, LytTR family, sensor kinase